MVADYLSIVAIARALGADRFGVYTAGHTLQVLLVIAASLGLRQGVVRHVGLHAGHPDKQREVMRLGLELSIAAGGLLGAVLWFAAPILSSVVFHMPALAYLLRIFAVSLPVYAAGNVLVAALTGMNRVATAAVEAIFSGAGVVIMAVAIMVSTFGCNNGLILAGARVYYAMARDGLFFRSTGKLNQARVPAVGLVLQCIWTCLLVLPRTRSIDSTGAVTYGNLYNNLLDYVIFAVLIFYVLTIIGLFILRRKRPDAERPYRAFGYPLVPALYVIAASVIMVVLLLYKTQTTWPGLVIVLLGVPVYLLWSRRSSPPDGAAPN